VRYTSRRLAYGSPTDARRSRPLVWAAAALAVLLIACTRTPPTPTPAPQRFRIVADAASLPLAQALADAYSLERPNVIFVTELQPTRGAFDALYAQRADFIIVSQMLPIPEGKVPPWAGELAQDGVVVVVNTANPLQSLSAFEIREVFAGARSRWSDVNLQQLGDVDLAMRDAGEIDRITFDANIMGSVKPSLNAIVLPTANVMAGFVTQRAGAIGYMPLSRLPQGGAVKALAVDGVAATPATLRDGSYRLGYSVFVLAQFEPQWEARAFAGWLLGAPGQRVVQRAGFVSLTP
jgi:phosphate transport system substrate-binding protein